MDTIRTFIAIRLPAPVIAALGETSQTLARRVSRDAVRWVRPEQIHLTLRFLGDTPTAQLPQIAAAMDAAAAGASPMALRLGGVGCFPNTRRPRVIWVGLSGDVEQLLALKTALDGQLALLGRPPEDKPFRAHLTLGRVKDDRAVAGIEWAADVPQLEVSITAIDLIESQLRPAGPIYTARHVSGFSAGQ